MIRAQGRHPFIASGIAVALIASILLGSPLRKTAQAQVPLSGWASSNVEWLGNVATSGPGGAVRVGRYLYVSRQYALDIYDISRPVHPQLNGTVVFPTAVGPSDDLELLTLPAQYPDGNDEVVLVPAFSPREYLGESGDLYIVDVRDKSNPVITGTLEDAGEHTYSCVLDCAWAYGAQGGIVDLRDPGHPRMAGNWTAGLRGVVPPPYLASGFGAHDVTEVRPGRVLTASVPMYLLDAYRPTNPRVMAQSDGSPHSFGAVIWPSEGKSRVVLSVSEALLSPHCHLRDLAVGSSVDSAFKTWNAARWKQTGLITGIEQYYVRNGTFTDGDPPVSGVGPNSWGCGALGFEAHPDFGEGGLVAHAASGHGTKFLRVGAKGEIEEVGHFLPYAGNSFMAIWITDQIVYSIDFHRGIDILRFTGNR